MSDSEKADRLLSEQAIIELAESRFGLGAIKVKELLRDIPGIEDKEKSDNANI